MSSAADEIAFLANSENRVSILCSLTDGPISRNDLDEQIDVSRVTLGRILDELEERRWITQWGQTCAITPLGEWVTEEYLALSGVIESERELRRVIQWFPSDGFGFHISCLADADVTLVSRADASAPISRLIRDVEAGGLIRVFSFAITSQFLETCWRQVTAGSVSYEWVFTSAVLDVLMSSEKMAAQSREMLQSDRAEYRLVEEEIPYTVIISRDHANLRLADAAGAATALIQSDDDRVRSWAESTFEDYWAEGTPVAADVFTP